MKPSRISRNAKSERTTSTAEVTAKRKKALVSFISYDQDNFDFKKTDKSFIESFMLGRGNVISERTKNSQKNRLRIWRPSVALVRLQHPKLSDDYEELVFDKYFVLHDGSPSHSAVVAEVREDLEKVKPQATQLEFLEHSFANPWNTREVYEYLTTTAKEHFGDADTDYYFNCTAGTTAMRNCMFLLTQTGQLKGLRISPTPWKNHKQRGRKRSEKPDIYKEDGCRTPVGSYTIENPETLWDVYEKPEEDKSQADIPKALKNKIITSDGVMLACMRKLAHLTYCLKSMNDDTRFEHPILLTGETGTGKSQLANNIRDELGLKGEFIPINCATIGGGDPNITRAVLFGCKAGLISGLQHDTIGALEKANGGVLFLDEIGELDMETQATLLTAIDEHKFTPLCGDPSCPVESSFQLVCGTNRDLDEQVMKGQFRLDLLNRINMWHFEIPPLRERRQDFKLNCRAYLGMIGKKYGKTLQLEPEAENKLISYCEDENTKWNGNFREFNALITRMVVLSFGRDTQPKVKITAKQVQDEIEHARACQTEHESKRISFIQREQSQKSPSQANEHLQTKTMPEASAEEFPILSEILSEDINKIPLPNRPWLEHVARTCRRKNYTRQIQLSNDLFGNDGKNHSGTLSKQLKGAGLKFSNGRIVALSAEKTLKRQ